MKTHKRPIDLFLVQGILGVCIISSVAAICHKYWESRPSFSLFQSSFLPLPLVDSPEGLGSGARSPAANHFDALNAVKQRYKIRIDA